MSSSSSSGAGPDTGAMEYPPNAKMSSDMMLMKEEGANGAGIPPTESREDVAYGNPYHHNNMDEQRDHHHHDHPTPPRKKAPMAAMPQHRKPNNNNNNKKTQQQQPNEPQHQQQQQSGRYYHNMQQHGHYAPPPPPPSGMPRGPPPPPHYGGPPYPPYPGAAGNGPFPPPPYHSAPPPHAHHQMPPMPHFNGGGGGGGGPPPPYMRGSNGGAGGNGPYSQHYGNHSQQPQQQQQQHPYAPNMGAAQSSYSSHGMPPAYPPSSNSGMPTSSDSASISSKGSKGSKKRTIDGVHESSSSHPHPPAGPQAYAFRRSDSQSSTTSTVTAGNNTSIETHDTHETQNNNNNETGRSNNNHEALHSKSNNSRHDSSHSDALGDAAAAGPYDDHNDDAHFNNDGGRPLKTRYHRRDYSADGSTTSSLSAGFSLASYEGARDHSDAPIRKSSPKRMKGGDGEPLVVDTSLRPPSVASHDADHSTRFEQLSIGVKEEPPSTKSDSTHGSGNQLFLALSTSPINTAADVDATPISKNTMKPAGGGGAAHDGTVSKSKSSIFKKKGAGGSTLPSLEVSTSDVGAGSSNSPTPPPVHGELGDSDMMGDDQSTLNRHLRGQSFTPVNHLSSSASADQGASHADGQFSIAPQLSWSIAGDTPSLGDLAEWEEESKSKHAADQKIKPSSTTDSHDESRNMSISPHDFHLWKEEHELVDQAIGGATTPLPAFFESSSRGNEASENHMNNYESSSRMKKQHPGEDARPTFITSSGRHAGGHGGSNGGGSARPMPPQWSKHEQQQQQQQHMGHPMPPTPPMYASGAEYRDDSFPLVRSPYGADRRDQIDGAGAFPFFAHPGGMHSTDRVRNLRGRMPPNAHFPPMLHIPPPMSAQLPMTSPMALPNKAGLWSPHGGLPPLSSPHHLTSPMNSMSQTKRKCVPLKPPIPSKFQGDPEKVKNIPVPEFTSLVNFPSHMSQKQAVNLPEGMRCCVMCGNACPSSNGGKNKNKKKAGEAGLAQRSGNSQDIMGDKSNGYAQIPTQNKGLCTLCDVNVWVVVASGLEIKWCKGCKNFRPWAAFGDKGLATKCLRCRERQREKYALQKEEKEKARNQAAIKSKS